MNQKFESQLAEVYNYYNSSDFSLALRRLTDCAIETQNTMIFKEMIDFYEWLENNEKSPEETIKNQAFQLLEKIKNVGVSNIETNTTVNHKILSLNNVSKAYRKSGFKINNLTFDLHERQITGMVGENGNGKTTLLRLLAAELKPDEGNINYHFTKNHTEQYELKTKLIYIEQRIPRWHGTLMDNLKFVLPFYGMNSPDNHLWAEIMIARLGLRPYRHLTWGRISSGYRTRFELAKTLLRKPKILLLDEPLANLDIISQQTILQDLKYMANSINNPFGMILSSQHIYEVEKVSDNIIFIKNGIPQYQNNETKDTKENTPKSLIIELETDNSKEELNIAFKELQMDKIQYNGGVYLLYFSETTEISNVLNAMATHQIKPNYFRNISQSSRRFFIN